MSYILILVVHDRLVCKLFNLIFEFISGFSLDINFRVLKHKSSVNNSSIFSYLALLHQNFFSLLNNIPGAGCPMLGTTAFSNDPISHLDLP